MIRMIEKRSGGVMQIKTSTCSPDPVQTTSFEQCVQLSERRCAGNQELLPAHSDPLLLLWNLSYGKSSFSASQLQANFIFFSSSFKTCAKLSFSPYLCVYNVFFSVILTGPCLLNIVFIRATFIYFLAVWGNKGHKEADRDALNIITIQSYFA